MTLLLEEEVERPVIELSFLLTFEMKQGHCFRVWPDATSHLLYGRPILISCIVHPVAYSLRA